MEVSGFMSTPAKNVTHLPDELAHRVHSAGHSCGAAGSSSMNVTCKGMWML
jgi:hypothetical protein